MVTFWISSFWLEVSQEVRDMDDMFASVTGYRFTSPNFQKAALTTKLKTCAGKKMLYTSVGAVIMQKESQKKNERRMS